MTRMLKISPEPAKLLSAPGEGQLLHDALAQQPSSTIIRYKLAKVLNELDRFAETVALLTPLLDTLEGESALLLAQASFAMRDAEHLELASLAADRALSVADNDKGRARAMADQAKVQLRLGKDDEAISLLQDALALDVHCRAAFKRLAVQLLRQKDTHAVEQLTDHLLAGGLNHSRVIAARTMALAMMGRHEDAQTTAGIGKFLHRSTLAPPHAHLTSIDFNTALTAELTNNTAMRQDRFGTASLHTGRVDSPSANNPLWNGLLEHISRTIEVWANGLPSTGHPWLAARPEKAVLRSWCVMTGAEGFERWHMHPDGWLSGGYYPAVPSSTANSDKAGSIAFGLPEGLAGAGAAQRYGERVIRPEAGDLILFPSHIYHRTYPHGTDEPRICIAFDIIPA
jgi:tetratricopeptide (TPR) repeat protein